MSYLELLNLTREPFSNSPDPDAYCRTPTHEACLNRLEIAIRLRRGLNVVLGEVGTGKSTLCRCLLRSLGAQEKIDVFLLLDPGFEDADALVRHLCELFAGQRPPEEATRRDCVSRIQNVVFDKALSERRNLVLFIDEGQKLAPSALEVLRELLNFETNTEKLLQIVIFGQPELAQSIEEMPNFKDRINEYLSLKPLSMRESIRLVRHRLRLAGGQTAERLFTPGALRALHRASKGRPRQLMRLGHQMLLALIVVGKRRVTARMVRTQAARDGASPRRGIRLAAALLLAALIAAFLMIPERTKTEFLARVQDRLPDVAGWLSSKEVPSPKKEEPPSSAPVPAELPAEAAGGTETPAPPAAPAVETDFHAVPETLGAFTLTSETALADLVRALYGSASALEVVIAKNPDYRSDAGGGAQRLSLPAIVYTPPASMRKGVLLSLGSYATPEEVYAAWRSYGARAISVAIAPLWRQEEGLRFHILCPRGFSSQRAAWSWVSRFSPPAHAAPRLLPPFDESCLVFHQFNVQ